MNSVMYSSKTDQWSTPQDFFDKLNNEFNFDLDPCADELNHKCQHFLQRNRTAYLKIGEGIAYSAIRHMAKILHFGLKKHT